MTNFSSPTLSIICSTYNRPNTIHRLLGIINDQRCVDLRGVDVCVVDDGSPYGPQFLTFPAYRFPFQYIYRDRASDNTSRVYSNRNLAASKTSGEYILQVDDDVEFHPYLINLLQSIADLIQEPHWLLTPRISNNIDVDKDGYDGFYRGKDGRWFDGRVSWGETHWGCTDSSGMFMPRRTWMAVNGYDETLDGCMGFGDQELAIRVQKLGNKPGDVKVLIGPYFMNKADEETGSWRMAMIDSRKRNEDNWSIFVRKHPDHQLWTNV